MNTPVESDTTSPALDSEFVIEQIEVPSALGVPTPAPFTLALQVSVRSLGSTIAHVSNVEYVRWIDRIAELHGTQIGSSRAQLLAQDRMWFVSRHEVDYLGESFARDQLACATWISRAGRTTIQRETLIWRRQCASPICRASSRWVYIDLTARKPTRIPQSELESLQPLVRR